MSARSLGLAALAFSVIAEAHGQTPGSDELAVWPVRDGIYMIVGAGGKAVLCRGRVASRRIRLLSRIVTR